MLTMFSIAQLELELQLEIAFSIAQLELELQPIVAHQQEQDASPNNGTPHALLYL